MTYHKPDIHERSQGKANTPFTNYLHNLRRRHQLKQKELAALTGFKQAYVSALEVGLRAPTNKNFIEELIVALNLDPMEQATLWQAVNESQRNYTLPDDTSADISRMVSQLWNELGNLSPVQIRIITNVLQLRDQCTPSSRAAT